MNVLQRERLDPLDSDDKFRSKALLQAAVTEAFALLNTGKPEEAIAQIKEFADLAARCPA